MAKFQLIIDNQIADVYNEKDIAAAITYSISEVNDIEKRTNPTTNTLKIPGTKRNCQIFGYPEVADVVGFKGQKNIITGSLVESGTEVIIGIVNLKNVTRSGNNLEFEIAIIGNSGEWVALMKDADLVGVDIGGTHYKTEANINASLDGLLSYLYPLVNNGYTGSERNIGSVENDGTGKAKLIIDGSDSEYDLRTHFRTGDRIYGISFSLASYNKNHDVVLAANEYLITNTPFAGDSSGKVRSREPGNVRVEDRPLAVSVYEIFYKVFEDTGYQLASEFTESTFFKRLFILPGHEKYPDTFAEEHSGSVGLSAEYENLSTLSVWPFPFNAVVLDPGEHFITPYEFMADRAMHVIFTVVLRIKNFGVGQSGQIRFYVNGVFTNYTNRVTEWQELPEDYGTIEQEAELRLQAGDLVAVELLLDDTTHIAVSTDETLFKAEVTDKIIKGSEIIPGNHLPDIKRLDFVKAIRHLFNLYFLTDVNMKKVYVEPRDQFFSETSTVDWSAKLDTSKPVLYEELGADVNKKLTFGYKKDSADWGVAEHEKALKRDYQTYTAILSNQFSQGEKKILNELFAPTMMGTFESIGLHTSKVPKIYQEPEDSDGIPAKLDEYEPRILYYRGEVTLAAGEAWEFEGVPQTTYPCLASRLEIPNDVSLQFDDTSLEREMFTRYYANHVRTLNESRKITAYFKLNASDVQPFITPDDSGIMIKDYRALVHFVHRGISIHARIESINEYRAGGGKTTKVVLITDTDNTYTGPPPQINSMTFTNTNIWPAAHASGVVIHRGDVWSTVRSAAAGSDVQGDNNFKHGIGSFKSSSSPTFQIERGFLYFDTSALPDTATITAAHLIIYKIAGSMDQELSVFQGLQGDILQKPDYNNFGTDELGESYHAVGGLRRIDLNREGLDIINRTGWTKFCLREKHFDRLGPEPDFLYTPFKTFFGFAPASYVNRFIVEYTL